jgi:hypothetical protein
VAFLVVAAYFWLAFFTLFLAAFLRLFASWGYNQSCGSGSPSGSTPASSAAKRSSPGTDLAECRRRPTAAIGLQLADPFGIEVQV